MTTTKTTTTGYSHPMIGWCPRCTSALFCAHHAVDARHAADADAALPDRVITTFGEGRVWQAHPDLAPLVESMRRDSGSRNSVVERWRDTAHADDLARLKFAIGAALWAAPNYDAAATGPIASAMMGIAAGFGTPSCLAEMAEAEAVRDPEGRMSQIWWNEFKLWRDQVGRHSVRAYLARNPREVCRASNPGVAVTVTTFTGCERRHLVALRAAIHPFDADDTPEWERAIGAIDA